MMEMTYPIVKPISGSKPAAARTSGNIIIHSLSLIAKEDRMMIVMQAHIMMLIPTCWENENMLNEEISVVNNTVDGRFVWITFVETYRKISHFHNNACIFWFEASNRNANGTGHHSECQSDDDADVWYSILQTGEALAVEEQQQGHQTQSCNAGAGGHNNAGREETLPDCLKFELYM